MRCPKCVEGKAKHSVVEEDRSNLQGGRVQRSWDEQDQLHEHDPRWDLVYYRCSNGHLFRQATPAMPCPAKGCGFAQRIQSSIDAEMKRRYPAEPAAAKV